MRSVRWTVGGAVDGATAGAASLAVGGDAVGGDAVGGGRAVGGDAVGGRALGHAPVVGDTSGRAAVQGPTRAAVMSAGVGGTCAAPREGAARRRGVPP
jgi:hypothetical protein